VSAAAKAAADRWARIDPDAIALSWTAQLPTVTGLVTAAQLSVADEAEDYLDGFAPPADVEVQPSAFAGRASDGGNLASLLYQPAINALMAIGSGAPVDRALAGGRASLDMIVRTQVADAGRGADQVALTARTQVQGYVRQIVGNTCARCVILAGRFYRWNAGFQRHPRCLPAGVTVSGPATLAATRRWFQGELVVVSTAGGQNLPVTGNHPVLTDRGWLPAHLLQEGDQVVRSAGGQRASALVVPDEDQMPARIEDLWRPTGMMALDRVPTTAEDFHGDGGHGQVDVVFPDRLLRYGPLTAPRQLVQQEQFARRVAQAALLAKFCSSQQQFIRLVATPNGRVGAGDLSQALVGGLAAGSHLAGCGHAPNGDVGRLQPPAYDIARDSKPVGQAVFALAGTVGGGQVVDGQREFAARWDAPAGPLTMQSRGAYASRGQDLLLRLAGQVELDRVVEVRRVEWSGHVYNLTSVEGWYSANGLIVSNCDCIHVPANRAQWREAGRFHDPQQVYDSLSVAERQRAGWSLADQQAIAEGADLTFVTNMKGVTSAGARRSAGRLTPDQIYRQARGDRDEAIRLLRSNGYLRGVVVPSRQALVLAADQAVDLAKMTVPQLKALAAQRGVRLASRARKADIIATLGGKVSKVASGLEAMTVAQLRAEAKRLGVRIPSGARKADIVELLKGAGATTKTAAAAVTATTAEQMTVAQLKALAKQHGVPLPSGLKKADIITHIRSWETGHGRRILPGEPLAKPWTPPPPKPVDTSRLGSAPTPPTPTVNASDVARARAHIRRIVTAPAGEVDELLRVLDLQAGVAPHTIMRLLGVEIPTTTHEYRAIVGTANGFYMRGTSGNWLERHIYLNPDWGMTGFNARFRDARIIAKNNAILSGWSAPSGFRGVGSTLSHEFGHHVHRGLTYDGFNMEQAIADPLLTILDRELGTDFLAAAPNGFVTSNAILDGVVKTNHGRLKGLVSEYGASSFAEMLAEIWCEYSTMGGNARLHIQRVGAVLQRLAEGAA
jgi:hypothetical protein